MYHANCFKESEREGILGEGNQTATHASRSHLKKKNSHLGKQAEREREVSILIGEVLD